MSYVQLCDICKERIYSALSDHEYKVTVKRISRHYDGYAPFKRSTKLDICYKCIKQIAEKSKEVV